MYLVQSMLANIVIAPLLMAFPNDVPRFSWKNSVKNQLVHTEGIIRSFTFGVFLKIIVSLGVFAYGFYVIMLGIRTHKLVYFIGRIRWVTYLLVMFTPIVYNVIRMDFYTLLAIIVFFPLYYWIIEIFDRITPEPKTYRHS